MSLQSEIERMSRELDCIRDLAGGIMGRDHEASPAEHGAELRIEAKAVIAPNTHLGAENTPQP